MRTKIVKWLEVFVESVNYIIINYALSNMSFLFKHNLLYILFFASEIWIMGSYWKKVCELTKNKMAAAVFLIGCFLIHIGMIYFVGHISGAIIPFRG